jgi:hypothetical protein
MVAHGTKPAFKFKEGSDVFTPKDLVGLSRPGPGVANVPGDLILVPVSKYSFADKKCVCVSISLVRFILSLSPDACLWGACALSRPMIAHRSHLWDARYEEMCRKHVPSQLSGC